MITLVSDRAAPAAIAHPKYRGQLRCSAADEVTVEVVTDPDPGLLADWDAVVRGIAGSDVAQLSGWAQVRAEAGYRPFYLLARRRGVLVGGAQILRRTVPVLGGVGYLPYGPVVAAGESCAEVGRVLCEALGELPTRQVGALFVQPALGHDGISQDLLGRGFRPSEAGIAPAASVRVDLSGSPDELRAGLSRRLRTWTRQWEQRGVTVRQGCAADIPMLAALASRTARHHRFSGFETRYLDTMYHALSPERDIVLLIAELGGVPVAAELLTSCGGVLKSRITGLDRSNEEAIRLNVAGAMIWSAMLHGRQRGLRWYDFGGIRASTAELLLAGTPVDRSTLPGPDQFKLGFGGSAYAYPRAVERISSRLVRGAYDLGRDTRLGQRALGHAKRVLRGGANNQSDDARDVLPVDRPVREGAVTVARRDGLNPATAELWDRLVAAHPGADVTQLSGWGRLRGAAGYRPLYLLAYRRGALVGGAQVLRRSMPVVGSIGYLPYGPLVFDSDGPAEVRTALSRALRDLPRLGLRALFVQPPDGRHDISAELLALGFRHSAAGIAPRASVRIDLSRDETELRAALGKKLRRWTKRWPAAGVKVRLGDDTDLPVLAELHEHTARRHGFKPLSTEYLRRLYAELAPAGHARLFVGELDGAPVAALLATGCGGVVKTRVSGFDLREATAELRVPAAIRWHAVLWAKDLGYRWFDFGGMSETSTRELLAGRPVATAGMPGPDQFKLSFGGTAYCYPPAVELISTPALRVLYDLTTRAPGGRRIQSLLRTALRGVHTAR